MAIQMLVEGNEHFRNGALRRPQLSPKRIAETASAQRPFAVILACADSRVAPELFFDCGLGDIFVIRAAGNVVDPIVIGSIEYAVEFLNSSLVVVMGHTGCGAVISAIFGDTQIGSIDQILNKIRPAVTSVKAAHPDMQGDELATEVARINAKNSLAEILNGSVYLKNAAQSGKIKLIDAMYDVSNGKVTWPDGSNENAHSGALSTDCELL